MNMIGWRGGESSSLWGIYEGLNELLVILVTRGLIWMK